LYTPHPTKPGLFRYRGRKDDLVKLVWLAKVRAGDMESALVSNSGIAEAMVGGEGREAPFVIIQLSESAQKPDETELWSTIKALNDKLSAEVHIPRENIIVTDAAKPLKKLGKGTLDRRSALADYANEIENLYKNTMVVDDVEDGKVTGGVLI
jgi:acyl-coenzyme A synthetase/AMP-(fatty) acid ligase